MRIGYLTYGLDRSPTGIGRYTVELVKAMKRLPSSYELVLLTTERADPHGLWECFEHHPLPGCRLLPALLTHGNLQLSRAASRLGLDLIHDPNGIAPFLWPALTTPCVVTIHDAFAFVVPELQDRFDVWRSRMLLPAGARRAAAVITDSACSKRDLMRFLDLDPNSTHTVPLAVDERFQPLESEQGPQVESSSYQLKQPYLLYTGGINPRKNILRLLEAFIIVRAAYPELRLVIAGGYQWGSTTLVNTIERMGLAGAVLCIGYVADTDLPALYRAASCFVFPSLYEGFGLPPLEAMACGTPVVCSNSSSLPEVVGDGALTVDPYDTHKLAAAIKRVLSSPGLVADLRERGLLRAANFTWEQSARKTLAVYRQVLGAA